MGDQENNRQRTKSDDKSDDKEAMPNYGLVFQLVLEHDSALKNLTYDQTKNIVLSTKTAIICSNVMCMQKKYRAVAMYNAIYNYIMEIANAIYYSQNNRDRPMIQQLERECTNYLDYIYGVLEYDEELKDCLAKLINADYRDSLYMKYYDLITTDFELLFHDLSTEFYITKLGICDAENYKHNPTHYMFIDGYPYRFYDELEKDGVSNTYQMYTFWQAQLNEENEGFIYDDDTEEYDDDLDW